MLHRTSAEKLRCGSSSPIHGSSSGFAFVLSNWGFVLPAFCLISWAHIREHQFLDVGRTTYYDAIVIRSFRSKDAELIFRGLSSKRFSRLAAVIDRKLVQIHAARALSDISIFPGNRLEALKGNRLGQHSIRINDQYRLCFLWKDGDAYEVEIVDYH
jgi:toxin HigB-1